MKKNLIKMSSLIVMPALAATTIVSCAKYVANSEREEQVKRILNNYKSVSQNKLWTSILDYQYAAADGTRADTQKDFADKNSQFYKDALEAFNYYQASMLKSNPLHFVKKISEWASIGALSQDGTADSNLKTNEKLNLQYGQKLNTEQFDLIWTNPSTGIQEQVKKMLIVKEYFTNAKEDDIKKSEEYKENIKRTISTNEYNLVRTEHKDYFLNVALLRNKIADVWEYSNSDAKTLSTYSKFRVSNLEDYNLLSQTKQSLVDKRQDADNALATNDSVDTTKLFSYKGLEKDKSGSGDMNYSISHLKKQYTTLSGWLDNSTSRIFNTNDLAKSQVFNGKKEVIPVMKTESKNKEKFDITVADFTLTPSAEDQKDINYEIHGVFPNFPQRSKKKLITVVIKMTAKENPNWTHFYWVDVDWTRDKISYNPGADRTISGYVSSLSVQSADQSAIRMTYVNKIVPLANEIKTVGEGSNRQLEAFFTLNGTPWSSTAEKNRLSFGLSSLNDSFFTAALKYFENLGFKIEDKNSEIPGL